MRSLTLAWMSVLPMIGFAGCMEKTIPPARVSVPAMGDGLNLPLHDTDSPRRLPADHADAQLPTPPFEDAPLVGQRTPEQSAFVEAYMRVGRPRIAINMGRPRQEDRSVAPVDYKALETTVADWLACNGQVTLVSSNLVPSRANAPQSGGAQREKSAAPNNQVEPQAGDQRAKNSGGSAPETSEPRRQDADIVVRLEAQPTQQYREGPRVRLTAEAADTMTGVSIARALVDVPMPLEKEQINLYTRWLARKLMDDMTNSWLQPGGPQAPQGTGPAPQALPDPTPPQALRDPTAPPAVAPPASAPPATAPDR